MQRAPRQQDSADFRAAIGAGEAWQDAVEQVLTGLGHVDGATVGFLYVTDQVVAQASEILARLAAATGIRHWVGTTGLGVCGTGVEVFDRPAVSVLTARLPSDAVCIFPPITETPAGFFRATRDWLEREQPVLGLVHADPRRPETATLLPDLAEAAGGFLVGGLASSRSDFAFVAATPAGGSRPVQAHGLSGLLLSAHVPVATGLTQGCSPIGPVRTITAADGNIVQEIDDRPALEVFKQDIGELLARDLRRVAGYIFAALPSPGSDTSDYVVRNLVGIDPQRGWLAIGEEVSIGQSLLFTRRDRGAAERDLRRMVSQLKGRLATPAKAALYVSCLARGPHLFGGESQELKLIEDALGPIPLAGFFANGEISRDRLYGYTAVLTVFH